MRKTAPEDIREIAIPTLDLCPTDRSELMVRIDIAPGLLKPKFKYCDTCGLVRDISKNGKPVPTH